MNTIITDEGEVYAQARNLGIELDRFDEIDKCELAISMLPSVHCPLVETMTDGMYGRQCTLPHNNPLLDVPLELQLGTIHVSGIHLQQHQYAVLRGAGKVFEINPFGVRLIEFDTNVTGPFFGVTEANTRRVLFITQETVWKTFHPNPYRLPVDELLKCIISDRENPLLSRKAMSARRSKAQQLHAQLTE